MLDLYVFDRFDAAAPAAGGSKMNLCASSKALIITEIPMIFYIHIPWVAQECTAKCQRNCSKFREMMAIFNAVTVSTDHNHVR